MPQKSTHVDVVEGTVDSLVHGVRHAPETYLDTPFNG